MGKRRNVGGEHLEDLGILQNVIYNDRAGGQKNFEIGPALEFYGVTTAALAIEPGKQLYLFKTTTGLGWVTLGADNTIVAGTSPAADTFPVFGQDYTRISADEYKYIIGAADIFIYVLKDDSVIRPDYKQI